MNWIDFFWNEAHREEWKTWCENELGENEPDCRVGTIERGQEVMDYYFRLLCIAAYRRVSKSSEVPVLTYPATAAADLPLSEISPW